MVKNRLKSDFVTEVTEAETSKKTYGPSLLLAFIKRPPSRAVLLKRDSFGPLISNFAHGRPTVSSPFSTPSLPYLETTPLICEFLTFLNENNRLVLSNVDFGFNTETNNCSAAAFAKRTRLKRIPTLASVLL